MNCAFESLGLIAGNRALPLLLARQFKSGVQSPQSSVEGSKSGLGTQNSGLGTLHFDRIVAVAFEGETDPALAPLVDDIVWLKVGRLQKLIDAFAEQGVRHCVMAGQIAPQNLYELHPDLRALKILLRLKKKNAHTLFSAIADELKKEGIDLIEATPWLKPFMPGPGFHLGPNLSPAQHQDVEFGFRIAKEISRLDIGQTVVVKQGTVLAVEGFEGTDRCLARGGELGKAKAKGTGLKAKITSAFSLQPSAFLSVGVKVAKRDHDMRFDIPCLGPETLKTCAAAGIGALAFEADRSLLLEQEACADLAKEHNISVVTV